MPENVNEAQLEALIDQNKIVFVDFWAEWCAPCKQFATVYERVAKAHEDIKFVKVNIAEEEELAAIFQIQSIPHLIIFKQGIAIYSESGSMPESVLKELVEQARSIDISTIQARLAGEGDASE